MRFFCRSKKPYTYTSQTVGGNYNINQDFNLVKANRDLLSLNGINLNKVRFVFNPMFQYDIDADIINPNYMVLIPTKKNGLYDKKSGILEIKKPKNVISVAVNTYMVKDNYKYIKQLVKKSKRGIVIYINTTPDVIKPDEFGEGYSVDSESLRLRDLDEIKINIEETEQIL